MHTRMPHRIKNREQNKPCSARDREKERNHRANLVEPALVPHQLAPVSQPALSQKSEIQRDDSDGAHCDKQGFEVGCANVGDVPIKRLSVSWSSTRESIKRGGRERTGRVR